jgi:molybdopterin-synthase adenylyltransferase
VNDAQLLRYSRHLLLEEMGLEAQERLLASTALVLGVGGLGSPAALYLASAGLGHLILADGDTVDLTNLQRQIAHRASRLGMGKAASGKLAVQDINPEISVEIIAERLHGDALEAAVARCTVVLDCCDNFATRHAVNRACVKHRVPLVSGAAIRFDGQLAVYDARHAQSPCYHCLFPEDLAAEEVRCAVMGVFAPLTGIIGTMQAAEALKIAGQFGHPMMGRLQLLDARTMSWNEIEVPKDPRCSVCGTSLS